MTATPEHELEHAFQALEPPPENRARLESRVLAVYEAEQRSLVTEWLDLFRVGPVRTAARTVAAAVSLAVLTPAGTILLTALLLN